MTEARSQPCSFFLLRYVPDAVKNEFVNIGLVLLPPGAPPEFRLTSDWSRVRGLDPQADLELLQAFGDDLRSQLQASAASRAVLLKKIGDSFSGGLQASEFKVCLTDAPAREANELAHIYLESPRPPSVRGRSARQEMKQRMEQEWKLAGVFHAISQDIEAAKYTRPGDPLRIDFGYEADRSVKMFHATPLKSDVNLAKVLAFSFPALAEGVRRESGAQLELTAVVEDGLQRGDGPIAFALETLERQGIQIAPLISIPEIAARAAREILVR